MKDLNKCDQASARRLKSNSSRQSHHRSQHQNPQQAPKSLSDTVLKFIHLRYFPPGLVLQYLDCQEKIQEKVIDLLELNYSSNVARFASEIAKSEPLLFSTRGHRTALGDALVKLRNRCLHDYGKKFVKQYNFAAHACPVTKMCLSKDGQRLVTTSLAENLCSVWDLVGMRETALLKGHAKPITVISLNHFADKVLTGSEDGTVRLWELSSNSSESLSPPRGSNRKNNAAASLSNGTKTCQVKLAVTAGKVCCAEASSDFSMAASGCSDCTAYVHDLTNGIAMYRFGSCHSFDVTSVQFDSRGSTLLTASKDSKGALWDLRSGSLISILEGHKSEIINCIFNHSCQTVATCSADKKIRLWDVRMLGGGNRINNDYIPASLLYEFTDNEDEVLSIHFDSRGKYIASGCKDGTLAAWNVKTGELQFKLMNVHEGPIRVVRWSPNGGLLMTASDDKTVSLFHPDMATCIQTLEHHKGGVNNACFSYSNEFLVTSGEDMNCIIYKLEKPVKNQSFSSVLS